eukprot:6211143-Pleurochrysis_carterae.AAC.7
MRRRQRRLWPYLRCGKDADGCSLDCMTIFCRWQQRASTVGEEECKKTGSHFRNVTISVYPMPIWVKNQPTRPSNNETTMQCTVKVN